MSEQEEWAKREEEGKRRFSQPTYTIKDQYRSPDAPFFAPLYYITTAMWGKDFTPGDNKGFENANGVSESS